MITISTPVIIPHLNKGKATTHQPRENELWLVEWPRGFTDPFSEQPRVVAHVSSRASGRDLTALMDTRQQHDVAIVMVDIDQPKPHTLNYLVSLSSGRTRTSGSNPAYLGWIAVQAVRDWVFSFNGGRNNGK